MIVGVFLPEFMDVFRAVESIGILKWREEGGRGEGGCETIWGEMCVAAEYRGVITHFNVCHAVESHERDVRDNNGQENTEEKIGGIIVAAAGGW